MEECSPPFGYFPAESSSDEEEKRDQKPVVQRREQWQQQLKEIDSIRKLVSARGSTAPPTGSEELRKKIKFY